MPQSYPLTDQELALRDALDDVRARCDVAERRARDPVAFVHRYADPLDQELVALLAATAAFGNVRAISTKVGDALARLGPSPATTADDEAELFARLEGWRHRLYRGADLARLLCGARRVQRQFGSLGAKFEGDFARCGDILEALAELVRAIRGAGGLDAERSRGAAHLLPDPKGASGSKRLLLFLRWMIRPADGVDLGLWSIPPSALLCPVDVHVHRVARNLGFTARSSLSRQTTAEITSALARLDPLDPVKYDFSLCHLMMNSGCPSKRDPPRCLGCPLKPLCRHWR